MKKRIHKLNYVISHLLMYFYYGKQSKANEKDRINLHQKHNMKYTKITHEKNITLGVHTWYVLKNK